MNSFFKIPKPPFSGLGRRMESMVRKALYEYALLPEDSAVMVALSGGKDSLTLLSMLSAISGKGFPKLRLSACHVSGEVSCGAGVSIDFLEQFCNSLEIPLFIKKSLKTLDNLECYSCSRERRTLLFKCAKQEGFSTIAFGHTKEDNAETLLMNILHKGEVSGILPKVPMWDYEVTLIRPLIFIDEKSILEFAKQHQFLRVSCGCPVGAISQRKRVDRLIKDLAYEFPHILDNLSRASLNYGSKKALER